MDKAWKDIVWHQFGATITMLENALSACPDELWREHLHSESSPHSDFGEFWYVAYHTLFWLDFYLSDSIEGFAPPAPFTLSEFDAGLMPERVQQRAASKADHKSNNSEACFAKISEFSFTSRLLLSALSVLQG